jgi:hypothetical protein
MFPLQAHHLQHPYLILCNDVDCKETIYNKNRDYRNIHGNDYFCTNRCYEINIPLNAELPLPVVSAT